MEYLVWFLISFIIIYLFYFVTVILQKKKYEKFKSSNQVLYFVKKYKIDVKKLNISKFVKIISFTNSLIIAITFTIATITDNFILILLIGFITLLPLMLLSYHIIGLYLKKEENK